MTMQHAKIKKATFGWWLLSIIPILNWYWNWKVSKMLVNHEEI
jgi:hypothetical protein